MRLSSFLLMVSFVLLAGCGPKYPNCESDKDCAKEGKGEVCLNGKCSQCKDDKGCPTGQSCSAGVCQEIAGFCSSKTDCNSGEICVDNRCAPGCEVSADCPSGQSCRSGECVDSNRCDADADCVTGQRCESNRCVTPKPVVIEPASKECSLEIVFFSYDSDQITDEQRASLEANASCANASQNTSKTIVIRGYTDPRGTEEYNLTLGERRAQAVKDYLSRLGVSAARLRTFSVGEEYAAGESEDSWLKDRRAELAFE